MAKRKSISEAIFEHLVQLAQFELTAEEGRYLRRQLNDQLEAIRQLEAIEVGEEVPITSHGVPYSPDLRQDLRPDEIESSEAAEDILAAAPEREDRFVAAPDIPHEDLE